MQKRFAAGLAEIGGYLAKADFDALRLVQGTTVVLLQDHGRGARATAPSPSPARSTRARWTRPSRRSRATPSSTITIKVPVGLRALRRPASRSTSPRWARRPGRWTPSSASSTASSRRRGFQTRIGREQIKAEPQTVQVAGKPVTLPAGPDRWALAIRGTSTETVGFTAASDLRRRLCRPVRGRSGHDRDHHGQRRLDHQDHRAGDHHQPDPEIPERRRQRARAHRRQRRRDPVGRRPTVAGKAARRRPDGPGQRRRPRRLAVDRRRRHDRRHAASRSRASRTSP